VAVRSICFRSDAVELRPARGIAPARYVHREAAAGNRLPDEAGVGSRNAAEVGNGGRGYSRAHECPAISTSSERIRIVSVMWKAESRNTPLRERTGSVGAMPP
jgi:hypothetical protein